MEGIVSSVSSHNRNAANTNRSSVWKASVNPLVFQIRNDIDIILVTMLGIEILNIANFHGLTP
jgi:hypothetical protein